MKKLNFSQAFSSLKASLGKDSVYLDLIKSSYMMPKNSWQTWIDPYGYGFSVKKNIINIYDTQEISCINDIFIKSHPKNLLLNSNKLISFPDYNAFWFYGKDKILRYSELNYFWENKSPLIHGAKLASSVLKSFQEDRIIEDIKKHFAFSSLKNLVLISNPLILSKQYQEMFNEN